MVHVACECDKSPEFMGGLWGCRVCDIWAGTIDKWNELALLRNKNKNLNFLFDEEVKKNRVLTDAIRQNGRYGITATELHAQLIDSLKQYARHMGDDASIHLDNHEKHGLDQTILGYIEQIRAKYQPEEDLVDNNTHAARAADDLWRAPCSWELAKTIIAKEYADVMKENRNLRACMKRAGLECFLGKDPTPDDISKHMAHVANSWVGLEDQLEELKAEVRMLTEENFKNEELLKITTMVNKALRRLLSEPKSSRRRFRGGH